MDPFVAQFHGFVADLTTVEKRSIVALTEFARDALRTNLYAVPSLAAVIINRISQAPPQTKLPVLYLLDSISKNIGEPYKSYFAPGLPDAFYNAWMLGGPSIHKPLDKLLNTWNGVFAPATLDAIRARMPPGALQPAAVAIAGGANGVARPMVPDPRLAQVSAYPPAQVLGQQQQQYGYPAPIQPFGAMYPAQPQYAAPIQSAVQQAVPVAVPGPAPGIVLPVPSAVTPLPIIGNKGKPQSTQFSAETLKEHNPAAVERLLSITNVTKSLFLDRKFLRRQQRASHAVQSRMWYVDLDTWMATAAGGDQGAQKSQRGQTHGKTAVEIPAEKCSVPVDDEQTKCALSGERFEQYWDEDHQEWRYKDAKKLTADEAAGLGLDEGAIVLVSALGSPAPTVLGNVGVVHDLVQGLDLDAAIAAVVQGEGPQSQTAKRELDDDDDDDKKEAKRVKTEA